MSTHDTSTADGADDRSPTRRMVPAIGRRNRSGTLATVAGGAMLLWAARTLRKNAGKAALSALAGVVLLVVGRRQRRTGARADDGDTGVPVSLGDDGEDDDNGADAGDGTDGGADSDADERVSDDAHAEATQDLGAGRVADESRTDDQSDAESNPRGTADEDEVQEDDGDVEFVEETEPSTHEEPHLDEEHDTRLDTEIGDEATQVDVSESATADEASEATGPDSEQAFPTTEGTDPEPQSEEAPPRSDEEVDSSTDSGAEEDETDDESAEASEKSEESS